MTSDHYPRWNLHNYYRINEKKYIQELLNNLDLTATQKQHIQELASDIVIQVRKNEKTDDVESFMEKYDLSNEEGVTLMCLAEALLRIPDKKTIDELIQDKIGNAKWEKHVNTSKSVFVNASTWGLLVTGKVITLPDSLESSWLKIITKLLKRAGEPLIRQVMLQAMRILGEQFVLAETMENALNKTKNYTDYRFSYDILGEAVRTKRDAQVYYESYIRGIQKISAMKSNTHSLFANPGMSIKLSALHPRYEFLQSEKIEKELFPLIKELCIQAKKANVILCIDAEEADRLEISLNIFEKLLLSTELKGWDGLGCAIQAYQKRAIKVIDYLKDLARATHKKIPIRLVKGAYWDYEIKHAQELGLVDYPVFTRKTYTDANYMYCTQKILQHTEELFPCFATHNAHTIAFILAMTREKNIDFELQKLHGMGKRIYEYVKQKFSVPCRIYAPVGQQKELLCYLIRRLLENGANGSFLNQFNSLPIKELVRDPIEKTRKFAGNSHTAIPLPKNIFGITRRNSAGIDLSDRVILRDLLTKIREHNTLWQASPLIAVENIKYNKRKVFNPAKKTENIGEAAFTTEEQGLLALEKANTFFHTTWQNSSAVERAQMLERAADLYEQNESLLLAMLIREAGKTLNDAIAELREAIDFLRYYAVIAKEHFANWQILPGPTGEENKLALQGRGVFLCISPWNFPLAIFTGQIAAALVTGNTVLAKPAETTSLIAHRAVKLLHEAGVPIQAVQLLPGYGKELGAALIPDKRIAGIAFTGSLETAQIINNMLAQRKGAIVPLIAETGGLNAMIVDSSALLEQATVDIVQSAFQSAGQRCSALRILFIQEEIYDRQIEMLRGAMDELNIDDPLLGSTDIGPIIDDEALQRLHDYTIEMRDKRVPLLCKSKLPDDLNGYFFAPHMYQLNSIDELKDEIFGPVLHVVKYAKADLDKIIDEINNTDYGLTFAVQSRIKTVIKHISRRINVGNVYVNRNQIGAVVGVQPFGGMGLSGTGPKAGGPHYLYRFATEKVISNNITAIGGNATLLTASEE